MIFLNEGLSSLEALLVQKFDMEVEYHEDDLDVCIELLCYECPPCSFYIPLKQDTSSCLCWGGDPRDMFAVEHELK